MIRPAAARADAERSVPEAVRRAAAELGLPLIGVPSALGGIADERSAVTAALVTEELARGDPGIATALLAPAAVVTALANYGSSTQQATYLPAFTSVSAPARASLALMEQGPLFDPLLPTTTAARHGSDLVINGAKSLVVGAAEADLLIISALVDGEPRLVLVEAGTRGSPSSTTQPWASVPRAPAGSLSTTSSCLPPTCSARPGTIWTPCGAPGLAWSAAACGTAQAVLDQLVPYVTTREAFGELIAHRQAVAFTVADIAIELAGLRLVVWRAASRLDRAGTPLASSATPASSRPRMRRRSARMPSSCSAATASSRSSTTSGGTATCAARESSRECCSSEGRPPGDRTRRQSQPSDDKESPRHDQPRGAREVHPPAGPGARVRGRGDAADLAQVRPR